MTATASVLFFSCFKHCGLSVTTEGLHVMETSHLKDDCMPLLSPPWLSELGRGWPLTSCTNRHQPLTEAVKQTPKHAAHPPCSHIPSQSPLCCPQWKSKHTRKVPPCKCEIHTGRRKICNWRFITRPKKTIRCKVLALPAPTTSCLSITLPALHQHDKYWRMWPLALSWTHANLWIVVSLGWQT